MSKLMVERASQFIKKLNSKIVLNFVSIADDEWMTDTYGADRIRDGLSIKNLDYDVLFGVIWRLMDDESKRKIANFKVSEWDGLVEKPIVIADPILKIKHVIGGMDEIFGLLAALGETRVKSNNNPLDNEKKSPAGDKLSASKEPLTSSQENTVTPSNNLNG